MQRYNCGWAFWLVVVVMLAIGSRAALAEEAVVKTKDGREFEGELVSQNDEQVVLLIGKIKLTLKQADVASVHIKPSVEEVYRQRRQALADDDLDGRYDLAYDMYEENAYDLALKELTALAEQFPDSEKVTRLTRVVEQSKKLKAKQQGQPSTEEGPSHSDTAQDQTAYAHRVADRLTQAQINRIRVYEIDFDADPRIQIPDQTLDAFLEKYSSEQGVPSTREEQARFKRSSGAHQLRMMFDQRAREFYGDVMVREDPPALQTFRKEVHRQYILNYCATARCHGGEEAPGDLRLLSRAPIARIPCTPISTFCTSTRTKTAA